MSMDRKTAEALAKEMGHTEAQMPDPNEDIDCLGIWLWNDPDMLEEIKLPDQFYCILDNGIALWPRG